MARQASPVATGGRRKAGSGAVVRKGNGTIASARCYHIGTHALIYDTASAVPPPAATQ